MLPRSLLAGLEKWKIRKVQQDLEKTRFGELGVIATSDDFRTPNYEEHLLFDSILTLSHFQKSIDSPLNYSPWKYGFHFR